MHEKRSDGSLARADAAHSGAAETAKARRTRGAGLGRSGSGWESGSGDDWHGEAGVPVDPVRVDVVWDRLLVEARPVLGVEELSAVSESGSSLKESPVGWATQTRARMHAMKRESFMTAAKRARRELFRSLSLQGVAGRGAPVSIERSVGLGASEGRSGRRLPCLVACGRFVFEAGSRASGG